MQYHFSCQITKRGAGINDRDGLTDMTLLHYAAKSGAGKIKAHLHSRKISTDRKFSENIILKVENFQLQNFFQTENLCRAITFYKICFLRKIFPSGNWPQQNY